MQTMKNKKQPKKKLKGRILSVNAPYRHFGLKVDPFTTLSLQKHNLDYFVGREALVERLLSSMFSLSNVGVAGEPGSGKNSLLAGPLQPGASGFLLRQYWCADGRRDFFPFRVVA